MRANNIKYAKNIQKVLKDFFGQDTQTNIVDTLADIRHLCDLKNLSFAELDRTAYHHYNCERLGKE